MSDDPEVPDAYDPDSECGAWRKRPPVIGAPVHHHVCRRFPEHEPPHVCHSCGATWTRTTATETAA
jgi:hypothetical protein